ncbi:hypothetical protein NL676_003034 [Syzygium grande]|nr:hypothetical protein NL676_003034 [Syzygium grande]
MVMALEMANKRKVMETSGGDQKGGAFSQGELTGTGTRMNIEGNAAATIPNMIDTEEERDFQAAIAVEQQKEEIAASSITKSNDATTFVMSLKKKSKQGETRRSKWWC